MIAAARTALPAALDEIERLRGEMKRLVGVIDSVRGLDHGMTPEDAVRDLGKMYCALLVDYSRVDEWWSDAEREKEQHREAAAAMKRSLVDEHAEVERLREILGNVEFYLRRSTLERQCAPSLLEQIKPFRVP